MPGQTPQLPSNPKGWEELLTQLYCGMQVDIPATEGYLQLRIRLEIEDDNTPYLLVVVGLYRPHPKSPSLWEGSEFFELGARRIMCGFDPWNAVHKESGVLLLQKTIEDIAPSVVANAIRDLQSGV